MSNTLLASQQQKIQFYRFKKNRTEKGPAVLNVTLQLLRCKLHIRQTSCNLLRISSQQRIQFCTNNTFKINLSQFRSHIVFFEHLPVIRTINKKIP